MGSEMCIRDSIPDVEVVGEPDYLKSGFINGIKHMNVEFTPVG